MHRERIAAEDSKFDLGYIHIQVPAGQSRVLNRRWEMLIGTPGKRQRPQIEGLEIPKIIRRGNWNLKSDDITQHC